MRSLFVTAVIAIATLVLGPVVIIASLLRAPQGPRSIYTWCVRTWARIVVRAAGVEVVVHGREHLGEAQGAVFVSNHVSWFDIFALAGEVPWCSFVAKAELRRIPLFGYAAALVGIVFIDRDNRKQAFASYEAAAKEVQRGRAVVVCPEGTRGVDYHLRPFKKGPFVLAIASQAPIIPTIVYGSREIMPKGSFWIRPGRIELHFLEPIATSGYDYDHRAELMTETWHAMADALRGIYGVTTNEHPVANRA
jgi:1-acyl-sn-glycerol-3-phosphate acyltransferase